MSSAAPDMMQSFLAARASIQNAANLLQDAELLAEHARWGTAYALAALSFEEIGKTMLYLSALTNPTITRAELDTDLRDHPAKLTSALSLHVLSAGQPEPVVVAIRRAADLAPKVHQAKMRGFYVDIAPDGACKTPDDVTADEAVNLIRDLGTVVDVLRPWLTNEALKKMTELASTYAAEFHQLVALGGQLVRADPDKAAEYSRAMLHGWVPEREST